MIIRRARRAFAPTAVAALALVLAPASQAQSTVIVKAAAPTHGVAPAGALPAVQFLVEWRVVPEAAPGTGTGGGLVVGTASPPPAGWTSVRSGDAAAAARPAGVRVANGKEAVLRLDAAQAQRSYDFVWTAQGQGVVSRDNVVHAVRSLRVSPRWPGGTAPVTLVLALAHSRPAAGPDTTGPDSGGAAVELESTVQLELDAWLTVALLGAPGDALQVRVTRR